MAQRGKRVFQILTVEDDPAFAYLIEREFKNLSCPCQSHWVSDGSEALDFLYCRASYTNAPAPDLVLLDYNMPRMNGLETLQSIKSDPAFSMLPVIVLTTSAKPAVVRKIFDSHANAFVQKPSEFEGLAKLIAAIEAFWLEFAVSSPRLRFPLTESDKGSPIAPQQAEVRNQAMSVDGSAQGNSASLESAGCETQRRLTEDFAIAVRELLTLHEQQFQAIVQGDTECSRFDLLIHMANEKKQRAKYEYLRHVESHGCSNSNAITNTSGT
jgi:two-component system response regulator